MRKATSVPPSEPRTPGLTAPLAAAGIPVFVVSTYDTDYLLVKLATFARARGILAGLFEVVG